MTTSLTTHSTIRTLVATFQEAEANTRIAFSMIVAAQLQLSSVFAMEGDDTVRIEACRNGFHSDFGDPDRAIERMSRQAWKLIVDRLELRRAMSVKRFAALEKQLQNDKLPPITEENVAAFVDDCMSNLKDMLEEAVGEVFEWLRPHGNTRAGQLKTNTELEVGRKVVISGMVRGAYSGGGYRVQYHQDQYLTALENVFTSLDGRGQIAKGYWSALHTAIEACGPSGVGETELFKFRVHRNGNMHLTMLREDLLAQFNQIAGGRRLRPREAA